MLRIAVCDDDPLIFKQIQELLFIYCVKNDKEYTISYFQTAAELLSASFNYSILFLDIMLDNNNDGIEAGKTLRSMQNSALFILTTSRKDRVIDGYEATVFRCLIKPITQKKLFEILDAAVEYLGFSSDIFIAKFKYQVDYIPIKNLIHIESYYRKRYIASTQGEFQTTDSWAKIEEQINHLKCVSVFFCPKKTHLINLMHVVGNTKIAVNMSNGKKIPFESEKKYQAFIEVFSNYLAR